MRSPFVIGSFLTLLLVGSAGSVFAQGGNAQLGGFVQDSSKALIPGVTIAAKNVGTSVAQTQITNESGAYSFPGLQPGTYEISAELPGFKKSVQREVSLPYAGQVRLNFTLEVGEVTQSIEVVVARDLAKRARQHGIGHQSSARSA